MTSQDTELAETARSWAVRVGDPAFDLWNEFTVWLEADVRHLAAYEAALDAADWAAQVLAAEPNAANEDGFSERPAAHASRWWGLGGAIAACLALVGAWFVYGLHAEQTILVPAGEHRELALADGSRVILNGGTKIVLDKDKPRRVELADGEALFDIRHNSAHPFVVAVGKTRLIDAGTTFNVIRDNGALEVRVGQGAVIYRLGQRQVRLDAGSGLIRTSADAEPVRIKADPTSVGEWQQGLLQYDDAPLDRVARDLSRNLGIEIAASAGAERMRFTGTLVTSGSRADVFARAAALMNVRFEQQGDGWRIMPTHDARR